MDNDAEKLLDLVIEKAIQYRLVDVKRIMHVNSIKSKDLLGFFDVKS